MPFSPWPYISDSGLLVTLGSTVRFFLEAWLEWPFSSVYFGRGWEGGFLCLAQLGSGKQRTHSHHCPTDRMLVDKRGFQLPGKLFIRSSK